MLYPIDYGDDIPWELIKDADVTVIDWSFQPWSTFMRAMQTARSITWIDHHKSAIKEFRANKLPKDSCPVDHFLRTDCAACELAWKYFFPKATMPWGVHLLGRYDVWDHEDLHVLSFQYGMRMHDMDPKTGSDADLWTELLVERLEAERLVYGMIEKGKLLLRYQQQNDAEAVRKSWFVVPAFGGLWQAVNRLGKGSSFFDAVWDPEVYSGMLSFGWDGKTWVIGLYSTRDDVDCSAIAKAHGGGGHKGAAGFRCDTLPFSMLSRS